MSCNSRLLRRGTCPALSVGAPRAKFLRCRLNRPSSGCIFPRSRKAGTEKRQESLDRPGRQGKGGRDPIWDKPEYLPDSGSRKLASDGGSQQARSGAALSGGAAGWHGLEDCHEPSLDQLSHPQDGGIGGLNDREKKVHLYSGHSLRAGFVTAAAAGGATDRQIMRQAGHKSQRMIDRYSRRGQLDRREAAQKVGF